MNAHMTIEEARTVGRPPILVGQTYTFYSDCVECKTDSGELIRKYSGQPVTVVDETQHPDDNDGLGMYLVRAANGDVFQANHSELNGWIFDTGQWVGPRVN